jgi:hypothetical protein
MTLQNLAKLTGQPVFHKVAENLFRLESSGAYYALLKKSGKQFRRSLKTQDRKLADRRLKELRSDREHGPAALREFLHQLNIESAKKLSGKIFKTDSAKKCLATACKQLPSPNFMRHVRMSAAVETIFSVTARSSALGSDFFRQLENRIGN